MKIKRFAVVPQLDVLTCDCGEHMKHTQTLFSEPPRFVHVCPVCANTYTATEAFPRQIMTLGEVNEEFDLNESKES